MCSSGEGAIVQFQVTIIAPVMIGFYPASPVVLRRNFCFPVLAIDDVTQRFNVTSKTIQRWRKRGLPGRRFVFPDGKRRVGFLLSSVERFFNAHREQICAILTSFGQEPPDIQPWAYADATGRGRERNPNS